VLLSTPPSKQASDAHARGIRVPLNAFQRVLRGWEAVHPYNAAQVIELTQPVDVATATAAWNGTLDAAGLGRVEPARHSYRHVVLNGEQARFPVRSLETDTDLEAYLSAELNRPFDAPGAPPFRPFLLPDVAAGRWHFGVVYQHWVADSVAIRLLLRDWMARVFAPPALCPEPLRHPDAGYLGLLRHARGDETAAQTLLSLVRRHLRCRRARKPVTHGRDDYPVSVRLFEASGVVPGLIDSAHRRGVKVNDLLLAAAAVACDGRVPIQHRDNRPDLAVGSIVDLRPLARGALDDRFGLFLGFAEVHCQPGELRNPDALVKSIARQNALHWRRGVWPSSAGWLLAAMAVRPLVKPHKLYHFFRKEAPLTAGVSNVNLNRTWVSSVHPRLVARYRRISPTGPLAPVVFSATSLGDSLQVCLTYRSALLTPTQAAALGQAYLDMLARLAG
jgi:hypothetical protein